MTDAIREAFTGLADALRGPRSIGGSTATTQRVKTLADLVKTAPTFDGSPNEYYLFKASMTNYLQRHQVIDSDEQLAVDVAMSACTGKARRYLGSLEDPPYEMGELWAALE